MFRFKLFQTAARSKVNVLTLASLTEPVNEYNESDR